MDNGIAMKNPIGSKIGLVHAVSRTAACAMLPHTRKQLFAISTPRPHQIWLLMLIERDKLGCRLQGVAAQY
jgi:hypothetical protein